MKIVWKDGYKPSIPAQVAYDVLLDLDKEGRKNAKALVEVSRPEDAPLHALFEWDDSVAAEKYREYQGRWIIRHIGIQEEPENVDEPAPIIRALFQIDDHSNDYEFTTVIMNDAEKYERLLQVAKKELAQFKVKYANLKELRKVFKAIDEIVSDQEAT